MKKILFLFSFLLVFSTSSAQKSMTFEEAEKVEVLQKIDSLYLGGINSDSTKSIFKNQKTYVEVYQEFLNEFADFLKKNDFKWGKKVRCFNRIYFSKTGSVDYFLYNFKKGEITVEQEKRFSELLSLYIQDAKFGLETNTRFAQCSPVTYVDL